MQLIREHWTNADYDDFIKYLKSLADEKYRKFHGKLIKEDECLLGIRVPILKETAKEICKGNYLDFIKHCGKTYHEEVVLHGLVVAMSPMEYKDFQMEADDFVKLVNNWAACDTFCSSIKKPIRKHKKEFWTHINLYLRSKNPWAVRVALISMLSNYMDETYIKNLLKRCDSVKSDFYYVQMAQAWVVATAAAKFPEATKKYFPSCSFDTWTKNKTIQKACESSRVSSEMKEFLKTYKK